MPQSVLFLTLRTFSATGGIEKVCRVVARALANLLPPEQFQLYSMYDNPNELQAQYVPEASFRGFGLHRWRFIWASVRQAQKQQVLVLSHVNLLLVALIVTILFPRVRVMLLAHGIEVWRPLAGWKKWVLRRCHRILAVSQFTADVMINQHGVPSDRVEVLHNALDPFLPKPLTGAKPSWLLDRYQLPADTYVFFTLTRIASTEGYKGYDLVLKALAEMLPTYPHLRYLIAGKYDAREKSRLDALIDSLKISHAVVFAGFIPDEELSAHFHVADCYIMPSQKEGFGIVFIEALYYGKSVIAGNKDGSVDALGQGRFGTLVNPDRVDAIQTAMIRHVAGAQQHIDPNEIQQAFGFQTYQRRWQQLLANT